MDHPDRAIWDGMLAHLRQNHPTLCRQWFTQIQPIGVDGGSMLLRAVSDLHRDYLRRECLDAFNDAARTSTNALVSIRFLGPDDALPGSRRDEPDAGVPGRIDRNTDDHAHPDAPADPSHRDTTGTRSPEDTTPHGVTKPDRGADSTKQDPARASRPVNPDYVSRTSSSARATARPRRRGRRRREPGAVVQPAVHPRRRGLGKTHLLQAICLRIKRGRPDAVMHYTSCDEFINDFMQSVQGRARWASSATGSAMSTCS
jgi:chromosomal replication initiator protein